MACRTQLTRLKAPYLKHILLDWNLPLFRDRDFELEFTTPICTGPQALMEAGLYGAS
ncbi:hypothetical protein [Mesorhizobium sangaii]|uniref:Uncharacterized protein n=1 Tax=Mesorhizobium sangaii TaxID=505389 RepID=A0A841NX39_9HYPH|nr:hypothetical protein [Mesorhizobium sangaii]MBB6407607.1 hypothetical protein [Mesorhizobium sangaii]